ncbi:MAG: cyclic nucleotide-binding domain-containing protein, partial [Deltaproteobacteria bacterium]|nr:cyclic nucleotide-binding domain-containing protein [Deltaproteobacteria bacterium]
MADPEGPPPQSEVEELRLEHVGREVTVPAGTCIVKQGEPPTYFYVIRSGKVKVFRLSPEGIRTELTQLGPGAYFGEVALVTGRARSASVEAMEEVRLLQVSKEEFDSVLDQNPLFSRRLIQTISEWLVDSDKRVEKEVVHQVKQRQLSWFDYFLMLGLSVILALVFNLYNDNQIPLVHGWGVKSDVPAISLERALEIYQKKEAVFIDARKSA